MSEELIKGLLAALEAQPDNVAVRLHLGELLLQAGRRDEAIAQAGAVLASQPSNVDALALLQRATTPPTPGPTAPAASAMPAGGQQGDFDWGAAEAEIGGAWAQAFDELGPGNVIADTGVTLADVGGLEQVKQRLNISFLAPLRNPELRTMYGKTLRGGLLLWGPPGCGKTFVAKALAGELSAAFLSVSLADVLDMFIGNSEKNVAALFGQARRAAPCVVFLDEIDALGQKRSRASNVMRGAVNQLLTELDGIDSTNDGVYVLGATNHPWDVDEALLRPGRLDRRVFVGPPDAPAREAILAAALRDRPTGPLDLGPIVKATERHSGADLVHLCETAVEFALMDSIATGAPRPVTQADLERARREVKSSLGPWLENSRNVVRYANQEGDYDDLAAYLKRFR